MKLARARLQPALLVLLAWTALALLESVKSYAWLRSQGSPLTLRDSILFNIPWWYMWALLTWPIVLVARRVPVDDLRGVARAALVHVPMACITAAIHLGVAGTLYYTYLFPAADRAPTLGMLLQRWGNTFFVPNVITYGFVAGICYAVEYARRYRESALAAAAMATNAERMQRHMTEARLHALQRELNPHFLFNALNAVSGLVRKRDNDAAVQMLARLGDVLRDTLDRGGAVESTLAVEMEVLERYVEIERMRFGERLHVELHMPADLRDTLIPTFGLQPLVENAIRHGVARTAGPGFVSVEAERAAGAVVITVRNTGSATSNGATGDGVGLTNTRARLEQLYGDQGALDLTIADDGEATVRLMVPFHTRPVIAGDA